MKKTIYSLFTLLALAGTISSCSGDDDGTTPPAENLKDGNITSQDDPDLDSAALTGNVSGNVTLTNDQPWTLTGPLAVKDGFTLTIEEGTTINAIAGGTNVYVVVEQGAKIIADGTAAAPIRFTSAADNPRSGDWGGLLINGKAPISGGGTSTTEVLPLSYGGTVEADNSGVLDYVILEYTGARINGEKEFNGLTLYAVGSGTQISNIAINKGDDDAIEFFGGTVKVTNLLAVDARDDMFDWTQGWTGQGNSNWYGIRTEGFTAISEDPRGIEADGNLDGNSPSDGGQSNPSISNVTIINDGIVEMADLVKIRRGSSATITGLYLGLGNAKATVGDVIDFTDGRGDANANVSVTGTLNIANGLDITSIKLTAAGAGTATLVPGTTSSVDAASFSWTGIEF